VHLIRIGGSGTKASQSPQNTSVCPISNITTTGFGEKCLSSGARTNEWKVDTLRPHA
jgi:hypothetical protein